MNVNELKAAFDKSGEYLQDLLNERAEMGIKLASNPEAFTDEEITKLSNEIKVAERNKAINKANYEEAKNTMKAQPLPSTPSMPNAKKTAEEIKNKFVSDFTNMVTSGTTGAGNAGLTIPEDIQLAIKTLTRSFTSLESLVNVENVSTKSGSRVYEKLADITPMVDLDDESGEIPENDDPELTVIKYLIHRYAGFNRITNTLLKDTADNIIAWLTNWVAKKDVITRNTKILDAMGKAKAKPTISNFDDIKDLSNNTLDPMIIATSSWVTNQSGFNVLSKLKDNEGRYMIQPNVTNPEIKEIDGHQVTVIADKFLPDVSGSHPIYFGDLKQGITLFDRQRMEIATTNVGGNAFNTDTTLLRFIDRFDVEVIDDGAWAVGSFKSITGGDSKQVTAGGNVNND